MSLKTMSNGGLCMHQYSSACLHASYKRLLGHRLSGQNNTMSWHDFVLLLQQTFIVDSCNAKFVATSSYWRISIQ